MKWNTASLLFLVAGGVWLFVMSQPDPQRSPAVTTQTKAGIVVSPTPAETYDGLTAGPSARELGRSSNGGSSGTPSSSFTFNGSGCSSDCTGHEAGYNWAKEHDIDDEDDCDTAGDNSNSPSFAEGCKAYVNGTSSNDDSEKDENPDEDQ